MAEGSGGANLDQNDPILLTESVVAAPPVVEAPTTRTQITAQHRLSWRMKYFPVYDNDFKRLENQRDQSIRELKETQKESQQLWNQGQAYKNELNNLMKKYDKLNLEYRAVHKEYSRTKENCHLLEKDNEQLRSVIANMSSARQPLRNEDHYRREFDCLNGEIENWAVGQSKKTDPGSFTEASRDEVISILESLGNYGKESAEVWGSRLFMLYRYRPTRMAFIRYVNGLFIFDAVLSQYSFGFNHEWSNYHEAIEDQLFHQGLP